MGLPGLITASLFYGYNLLLADPFSARDAGVASGRVFADGPITHTHTQAAACALTPSGAGPFTLVASGAALQAALLTLFELPPPPRGALSAAFSGGALFSELGVVNGELTANGTAAVLLGALSRCEVASASRARPAGLAPGFLRGVAALRADDPATLLAFSRRFGTHTSTALRLGGLGFSHARLARREYRALAARGFDFQGAARGLVAAALWRAANASEGGAAAGPPLGASARFLPARPPSPRSAGEWRAALLARRGDLAVTGRALAPLWELLTPAHFPGDGAILFKRRALQAFLERGLCRHVARCAFLNPQPVVAYFSGAGCPDGWRSYAPAEGALLLPVDGSFALPQPGVPNGAAWAPDGAGRLADPGHAHAVAYSDAPPSAGINFVGGGTPVLSAGTFTFSGSLGAARVADSLPLAQVATCLFPSSALDPAAFSFPLHSYAFFDPQGTPDDNCPAGWATVPGSELPYGLFLVPANGSSNTAPCPNPPAAPLANGQGLDHLHAASAHPHTNGATGFCGFSGGNEISQPRDWGVVGFSTGSASSGLPYLPLLFCKNTGGGGGGGGGDSEAPAAEGMLAFGQSCSELDAGVAGGAQWAANRALGGLFLFSAPEGYGGAVIGGGAPVGRSNCYAQGLHTHAGAPSVTSSPECSSFAVNHICANSVYVDCGVSVDGYATAPGSAAPPFVQLQLCGAVPSRSPTPSASPTATLSLGASPTRSRTPSSSPTPSASGSPAPAAAPAPPPPALGGGAVAGIVLAALAVGVLCARKARAPLGRAAAAAAEGPPPPWGASGSLQQPRLHAPAPPAPPPQKGPECLICFEAAGTRPWGRLAPCGHTLCFECGSRELAARRACPACRAAVAAVEKTYV